MTVRVVDVTFETLSVAVTVMTWLEWLTRAIGALAVHVVPVTVAGVVIEVPPLVQVTPVMVAPPFGETVPLRTGSDVALV
jgi:hypothetical protein